MHLLILSKTGTDETLRIAAAATARGHRATIASLADITISVAEKTTILVNGAPIDTFDLLLIRNFFPYMSEVLLIADAFATAGKRIIDTRLVTTPVIISKMYEATVLEKYHIAVPRTVQCIGLAAAHAFLRTARYPLVLKGVHGHGGTQVFRAAHEQAARRILTQAPPGTFLFQEYLPGKKDYRVITIGYRAIGAVERRVPAHDFRTNSGVGAQEKRTPLTPVLATIAETASRALGRECAGVDIRFFQNIPYVLEVNQTPGFVHFEKATGIDVADIFVRYCESLVE